MIAASASVLRQARVSPHANQIGAAARAKLTDRPLHEIMWWSRWFNELVPREPLRSHGSPPHLSHHARRQFALHSPAWTALERCAADRKAFDHNEYWPFAYQGPQTETTGCCCGSWNARRLRAFQFLSSVGNALCDPSGFCRGLRRWPRTNHPLGVIGGGGDRHRPAVGIHGPTRRVGIRTLFRLD